MTRFEIFVVVWPPIVATLTVGFGYFLGWLDDRAERRRGHAVE